MALKLTGHYLRNYPIFRGQNLTVLFLLSLMSGLTCGSQVIVQPKVNAVLGKNVTLACNVKVDANLTVTQSSWERKLPTGWVTVAVYNSNHGISISTEYEKRMSFRSPSSHDATIVLQDVGFADVGMYTCKVATFPLGNTQATTTVSVLVEPKVYVSAGSAALIDGENETTVATCIAERARPPAEVHWETNLFGTSEVHEPEDANGTTTTKVHYTWLPSRYAQGHTIMCVVKHPALQNDFRIPYIINVQFAPDILVVGYDGDWYVGRDHVQLKCQAKANPPAQHFRWIRLDGEMPDGAEMANNSLVFTRPLQKNDSGVYRCEVANDIGLRSRDIRVLIQDMSQKQMTSSMAIAGAVMGAVLAFFLIAVFTIVLLTARKASSPTYTDKVIDLPPTHKPPPPYAERPPAIPLATQAPQVASFSQARQMERRYEPAKRVAGRQKDPQNPTHHSLSYQEWICHQNGADRVYINHREHYV